MLYNSYKDVVYLTSLLDDNQKNILSLFVKKNRLTLEEIQLKLANIMSMPTMLTSLNKLMRLKILANKSELYQILPIFSVEKFYKLEDLSSEDMVVNDFATTFSDIEDENTKTTIIYALSEIINNVIDHSLATILRVSVDFYYSHLVFMVFDNGVGIFNKIKNYQNLSNNADAILTLAKGKFTTDNTKHSGEGIFFTSKACQFFYISSDYEEYVVDNLNKKERYEYINHHSQSFPKGTGVVFLINYVNPTSLKKVFSKYTSKDSYSFCSTEISLSILGSNLISRSQAKQVLLGLDKFSKIMLNFKGIKLLTQAFADEIFRVYKKSNPKVEISYKNTSPHLENMIAYVLKKK